MWGKKTIDADVLIAKVCFALRFCHSFTSRVTADDKDTRG
jgi:hypothetical protein